MSGFRKTFFGFLPALLVGALLPAGARAQTDGFKVQAVAIQESRHSVLIQTKRRSYSFNNALTVTLRFEGDNVAKATRYGMLQLTTAQDSSGRNLKMSRGYSLSYKRLRALNRGSTNVAGQKSPMSEYELPLRLELPDRSAKTLAVLKGSMTFAVGKTEKVTIPVSNLRSLVGKNIESDLLKTLKLTIKVEKYSDKSGHRAKFKITGDKRDSVLLATFVDPSGNHKRFGSYIFRSFKYTSANANTSKALPEGSTLQFVIETKSENVVVPFDLTDIPLK